MSFWKVLLFFFISSVDVASEISSLVSNLSSVTNLGDLVLWRCSYGPWDHFTFPAKKWIRLVFYQSDSTFLRKTWFSSWLARCKVPSWAMSQKAFIFSRKAFIFWESRLYSWGRRSSFWGVPDSADNVDKVARSCQSCK